MVADCMASRHERRTFGATVARRVPVAADPVGIAERLRRAGHDDVALLYSGDHVGVSYVAALADRHSAALDPLEDDELEPTAFPHVPRWIGVIPYECRRQLERGGADREGRQAPAFVEPQWRRYPAVIRIDHARGVVEAIGGHRAVSALIGAVAAPASLAAAAKLSVTLEPAADRTAADHAHAARIRRAIELIRAGDLYQVNIARRIDFGLSSLATPVDLFRAMVGVAPAAFSALLQLGDRQVLSTSPELLLAAEVDSCGHFTTLWTEPIKGTRPRGRDAREDMARARELDADPKERAELAMIVDVERNDLGRTARTGTVRLVRPPHVVTHRTVHHRKALLRAAVRPDATRGEVLEAMVPSGSVTGAPKVRAMEVIAELEAARRGLYTGGIGYVACDGGVRLAMAIRTVVLQGSSGVYWTGGGIVADSDPEREVEETRWKAQQLLALAQG